jgi:hypothetical protein
MNTKYKIILKVQEVGGGYVEREYNHDGEFVCDLELEVDEMVDTLEQSKEIKF